MEEYTDIDYLFAGLEPHIMERESLIEEPYREDDIFIMAQILNTLDDGMHVETCFWSECGIGFWDVSIDEDEFKEHGHTDFLQYLSDKGLPLHSVHDKYGKWKYGIISKKGLLRIQYVEVDDENYTG